MRALFLMAFYFVNVLASNAQTSQSILAQLKSINEQISIRNCDSKDAAAITHRAMSVFLADKTSYLSEYGDLSFYTNYVTINSLKSELSINHNFQTPDSKDETIKKLFSVGVKVGFANQIEPVVNNSSKNELGLTLSYKWIGKVKTKYANCTGTGSTQKQAMDALRISILYDLENDLNKKESEFKANLDKMGAGAVQGDLDASKAIMTQNFYKRLEEGATEKFVIQQAEILTSTANFKLISTHWTSLNIYVPMVFPNYKVANSLNVPLTQKNPYPLNISLSHTRFWENAKLGRFFFTVSADALFNSSAWSYSLEKLDPSDYILKGGIDTTHLNGSGDKIFLGDYKKFISPLLKARFSYFPRESHVGLSFSLEKYFGTYKAMNAKLGIPIVLINSKKLPAVNFEIDVLFFDINNTIDAGRKPRSRTYVGIEMGIPLSRLMY